MSKTNKYSVFGMYNRYGYAVYEILDNGYVNTLYTAGNARYDSTTYAPLDSPQVVSLRTLRAMCITTTREVAKEQGAKYTGVERDMDTEKNEGHAPI